MYPNPRIHEPSPNSYLKVQDPSLETITHSTALWKVMTRRAEIDRTESEATNSGNRSLFTTLRLKLSAMRLFS